MAPSGPNPRTQAPGNRQPPTSGSVLAFDFGERRVGVAVGDLGLAIAHPLETIDAADNERRFERIAQLVVVPVLQVGLNVVDEFPESERGGAGFGSTGQH